MLNRTQRRLRAQMLCLLRKDITKNGIESMLDRIFGKNTWQYDAREHLWIVPDTKYKGPGREYYCMRENGDWFKARLGQDFAQ
jgi:hypothetical protein